jgi:hypothetical protein
MPEAVRIFSVLPNGANIVVIDSARLQTRMYIQRCPEAVT